MWLTLRMTQHSRGNEQSWNDAGAAMAWLRHAAWPTWLAHGIDRRHNGFREHLTLNDLSCTASFRRLRVVTRQIYVFSLAAQDGQPGARAAVALGLRFLHHHAKQDDGGYAWRFAMDGTVIDDSRDLYDHAFVLLALSSAGRLMDLAQRRNEALALGAYIEARFAHPAGGFVECLPPRLPRRQNPHMHLLEANLHAFETFGDALWLDRADALVRLFFDRLFDQHTGALAEFFDDDWSVQRVGSRYLTEPGHHFEWVWLLTWYRRLGGRAVAPDRIAAAIERLEQFADRFGCHPDSGWLIDTVWSDGTPHAMSSRLWPQAERLKAACYRSEPSSARIKAASDLLGRYRSCQTRGLWHEQRDPNGIPIAGSAPASSLYHLTSAITAYDTLQRF